MTNNDFRKYIESIGFKYYKEDSNSFRYDYKSHLGDDKYRIDMYIEYYNFYNGSEWIFNNLLNDLTPLKKVERSFKLKKILG